MRRTTRAASATEGAHDTGKRHSMRLCTQLRWLCPLACRHHPFQRFHLLTFPINESEP